MQVCSPSDCGSQCAPQLGRFEYGIIKRKVRQIIGRAGFTRQDREDLEQELLARLLQALKSFDPNVAHRKSFVTAVVERAVANILRDKQAEKRDHRRISSLQVTIEVANDGSVELAETISDREYDARRGSYPRCREDLIQLASDLDDFKSQLPDDLQEIFERLKTESIAAIARDLGIPRTTLNDTVRRLRQRCERAALRDYL